MNDFTGIIMEEICKLEWLPVIELEPIKSQEYNVGGATVSFRLTGGSMTIFQPIKSQE